MGCFSYMCNECNTGVNSSSFDGERCRIYFLVNGKVVEEMRGRYDSYGRVFIDETSEHHLYIKPIEEFTDEEDDDNDSYKWKYASWHTLVDMHFAEPYEPIYNEKEIAEVEKIMKAEVAVRFANGVIDKETYQSENEEVDNYINLKKEKFKKLDEEYKKEHDKINNFDYETTGFAIVHEKCYKEDPKIISKDDPDQGWNEMRYEFR